MSPRLIGAVALGGVLVLGACASGGDATPTTIPVITLTPPTVESSTSTTAVTLVPETSLPVETTTTVLLDQTTIPATTTTTEPLATLELLLRGDGIGSARFGAAPDGVVDYVRSILGGATNDTLWVDPFTFAICDGTVARRVEWGVLSLLFTDLSTYASGRRHFIGWEYGRVGEIGGDPVGLRTPGGTTIGTRVVDLLADFPDASINEGEDDLGIPPNFYVSDDFRGLLTGTGADDVVTVIFGGYGCSE